MKAGTGMTHIIFVLFPKSDAGLVDLPPFFMIFFSDSACDKEPSLR